MSDKKTGVPLDSDEPAEGRLWELLGEYEA